VPLKFRYPFLKEIYWYVLERYVCCLTGVEHRERSEREILLENGDIDFSELSSFKLEPDENSSVLNKTDQEPKSQGATTEFKEEIA
jgi:hypothetical protein